MKKPIRAWHINEDGEIYAGRCDEAEMKAFFEAETGEEVEWMREIPQEEMDVERDWHSDDAPDEESENFQSTYRKEAEECVELPCQICTAYL